MKYAKHIIGCISLAGLFCLQAVGQCPTLLQVHKRLVEIETANSETYKQLAELESLEKKMLACKLPVDSVLARLCHRAGLMHYRLLNFSKAIEYTQQAARINSKANAGAKSAMAIKSYRNLGLYFKQLFQYSQAVVYFDSACMLAEKKGFENEDYFITAKDKLDILFELGDYQKCIEWTSRSLLKAQANQFTNTENFYHIRALAYMNQGLFGPAHDDANQVIELAKNKLDAGGEANGIHLNALIFEASGQQKQSLLFFKETLAIKQKHGLSKTNEHLNIGNFYLMTLKEMPKAKFHYEQALKSALADQNNPSASDACNGLAAYYFNTGNPLKALSQNRKALNFLSIPQPDSFWQNPTMAQLNKQQQGNLLLFLYGNKTEQLLGLYAITNQKKHLDACLQTALLTDSIITQMRHTQFGEQSKLYWRKRTREFYAHAIEACWLAKNNGLAFYFMEKSKAILLTDKLKELGAKAYLPAQEAAKDQALKIAVTEQEQKLQNLQPTNVGYQQQYLNWIEAKNQREIFIKTLEKNHPSYYWYKYSDRIPNTEMLRQKMKRTNQQFVHYFLTDTALYMLQVNKQGEKIHKINTRQLSQLLPAFAGFCANNPSQNSQFQQFAQTAFQLYHLLFKPLGSQKGSTIICPDQFLIPFEALCKDSAGTQFLIYDQVFQYAYSAGYWLMENGEKNISGDFLGLAPATFAPYLKLAPLNGSIASQKKLGAWYNSPKMISGENATRKQFFRQAGNYAVINVYAHARADSLLAEPVLYMADSMIALSELQNLQNPGCQLVILSACQTNAGKLAEGEGIYSLARGFAAAGIPATLATLWNADEKSTYQITEYFHEFIAQGLPQDLALQQAKLQFLISSSKSQKLPHFWANYVLMGHSAPLNLNTQPKTIYTILIISGFSLLASALFFSLFRHKRNKKQGLKPINKA